MQKKNKTSTKNQLKLMRLTRKKGRRSRKGLKKVNLKSRKVAEKNKLLKKKKKVKQGKKTEKEMWDQLRELNKGFNDIKKHKKKAKTMSETILG